MPAPDSSVLLVEDDADLRVALADNLEEQGYQVAVAATVKEAWQRVAERVPEVVVLDVMLPDGDGYAFCRALRDKGLSSRVLMLTARTLEEDLLRGFEAGADDYLAKPYRLRELLARVAALARRPSAPAAPESIALGGFTVDVAARTVMDARGKPVALTRTEFELLLCLHRNRSRVMTRDELLDAVWGQDVVVDSHTVDNFVSSLKKKLAAGGKALQFRSVRGVGYQLVIDAR